MNHRQAGGSLFSGVIKPRIAVVTKLMSRESGCAQHVQFRWYRLSGCGQPSTAASLVGLALRFDLCIATKARPMDALGFVVLPFAMSDTVP